MSDRHYCPYGYRFGGSACGTTICADRTIDQCADAVTALRKRTTSPAPTDEAVAWHTALTEVQTYITRWVDDGGDRDACADAISTLEAAHARSEAVVERLLGERAALQSVHDHFTGNNRAKPLDCPMCAETVGRVLAALSALDTGDKQ